VNQDTRKLLEQMCAHGFAANLNVLVKYNENTPQDAWIPASAIRILARRGDVPEEAIDALIAVFDATQEMAAQVHLMKALAAFGRKASDKSLSTVFEKIESTDPGTWTKKMTSHQIPEGEAVSKISPWMTR